MYWIVLVLALEGPYGTTITEHYIEPVAYTMDACQSLLAQFPPSANVFYTNSHVNMRYYCEKRSSYMKQ